MCKNFVHPRRFPSRGPRDVHQYVHKRQNMTSRVLPGGWPVVLRRMHAWQATVESYPAGETCRPRTVARIDHLFCRISPHSSGLAAVVLVFALLSLHCLLQCPLARRLCALSQPVVLIAERPADTAACYEQV
jgi:hypothetical protein